MINRKLRSGEQVEGFEILDCLSEGQFAFSYRARDTGGRDVFLKQYKIHTLAAPWFERWFHHQEALWQRIESTLRELTYARHTFFITNHLTKATGAGLDVDPPTYFQAYEFVSGVTPIGAGLATSEPIEARLQHARVFMLALKRLHEAKIVHTDLKPDNAVLRDDPTRPGRQRVQLVDLDWAIFDGERVPYLHPDGEWSMGIVGTEGYLSPEHLSDETPTSASDIYTAGLMLYEVLDGRHPLVRTHGVNHLAMVRFDPPALEVEIPWLDEATKRSAIGEIQRMLHPDPATRPSAGAVLDALIALGRGAPAAAAPAPPPPPAPARAMPPAANPVAPAMAASSELRLQSADFRQIRATTTLVLNAPALQAFGEDARFWDPVEQCRIVPDSGGWTLQPRAGTQNATTVNGSTVTAPTPVRSGDTIAVGNPAKGVFKLPLVVR